MGVGGASDSLFFAIRPDEAAAVSIALCCEELRAKHGLKGRPISAERLHITLHFLGEFEGVPDGIIKRAGIVAGSMHAGPFEIALDYAWSFYNPRKARFPVILGSEHPPVELKAFQKGLSGALRDAGLKNKLGGFTPHLTLLYDAKVVKKEATAPIRWRVDEFVLLHSFVGQSRYETFGRWPLRGI